MKRFILAMLAGTFLLMGILMVFFALSGIQTIQWCIDNKTPIPWQAWAMLITVTVWCIIAANIPEKRLKDLDYFTKKLTEE